MRPNVIVNPRTDAAFVAAADGAVAGGVESPSDLELALRDRYPRVVVHERALSGESFPTWYLYREGTWIPSD